MKHLFVFVVLAVSFFTGSSQIPNAGMEFWDSQPVLVNWETNSHPLTLPPYDPYIVKRDTGKFSGTYAALFFGNGVLKPYARTTFAVSSHPRSLSLWYRLAFAPCVNDSGYAEQDTVGVLLELLNNGAVVDSGMWQSKLNELYYTQLNVPLTQDAIVYDSCRITIRGGKNFGGCGFAPAGTQFWVDALWLNYADSVCVDSGKINTSAVCTGIYDPVCGCNGITYSNQCVAENYGGVTGWTAGECTVQDTGICNTSFTYMKNVDSVSFSGYTSMAQVSSYYWSFGDDNFSITQNPVHEYSYTGWFEVCLSVTGTDSSGNNCSGMFCDTIYISDGCIDSSLICEPGSLCCDAPLFQPVCGCDSVTYTNACIASMWGGVLWTYDGECVSTTGLNKTSDVSAAISLVPNPVTDEAVVRFVMIEEKAVRLQLLDAIGRVIWQRKEEVFAKGIHTVPIATEMCHPGIYILQLLVNNQPAAIKKMVKQ